MKKITKDGKRVDSIKKGDKDDDNYEELTRTELIAIILGWIIIMASVFFLL
jgi:hypothetical protein